MKTPISAYDLAREISRELQEEPCVLDYGLDTEREPYAELLPDEITRIVERMIATALRNGGIRP